jgi:hypothetical protein
MGGESVVITAIYARKGTDDSDRDLLGKGVA